MFVKEIDLCDRHRTPNRDASIILKRWRGDVKRRIALRQSVKVDQHGFGQLFIKLVSERSRQRLAADHPGSKGV